MVVVFILRLLLITKLFIFFFLYLPFLLSLLVR